MAENQIDKPNGGFPPIYICPKKEIEEILEQKKREYSKITTAVPIKDIITKRRNITPFIVTG